MIFFQIRIPLYLFPHRFAIRLALSSLALSGLALSGLALSGLALSGLALSGLALSGLALSGLALSGLALSNFENLTKLISKHISKLTASYRKNKRIKKANRKLNSLPTPLKQIFT